MDRYTNFYSYLTTKKRYIILFFIETLLFLLYYIILDPSNFGSFSQTLQYFISALATLLAIVVTFNTIALQYHLKNMAQNKFQLEKQLDDLDYITQFKNHSTDEIKEFGVKKVSIDSKYFTNALENMIKLSKNITEHVLSNTQSDKLKFDEENINILKKLVSDSKYVLKNYKKNNNSYFLLLIPTTLYIHELKFNMKFDVLFNLIQRLHILKNISSEIYIRNTLTNLSLDLLFSVIPILVFTTFMTSISNNGQFEIIFRILYSLNLAAVVIPFIILFLRLLPLLSLIRGLSTMPFVRKTDN